MMMGMMSEFFVSGCGCQNDEQINDKIFVSGCGCSENCSDDNSSHREHACHLLLRLHEFTISERDMYCYMLRRYGNRKC